MDVRISLDHFDVDEMRSLRNWLGDEPAVRRFGHMSWSGMGRDDAMGDAIDVISLCVTAGLSMAQLVVSLLAWRDSRADRKVTIVIEHRDGMTVLDGTGPGQPDRAMRPLPDKAAVRAEP